jgi:hypothetical protein
MKILHATRVIGIKEVGLDMDVISNPTAMFMKAVSLIMLNTAKVYTVTVMANVSLKVGMSPDNELKGK